MKYKNFFIIILLFLTCFVSLNSFGNDQFNFNVKELEILKNGNIFKGLNRGTITTNDGVIINADTFEYNKLSNTLNASGNVKIEDTIKSYIIFTDNITYQKNDEIIFTKDNSKGIDKNGQIINADNFRYDISSNIINAKNNVVIKDTINDLIIFAEDVTYLRNQKKIFTKGKTESNIQSKYNIKSKDIVFFVDFQKLTSENKTIIKDNNSKTYHLDKFSYLIKEEKLKGENIIIISDFGLPSSDKIYFSSAFINFKENSIIAKDTKIEVQKGIFGNNNNDPRLYGASSNSKNDITTIKKGIFTSCQKTDKCPPWSIQADEIVHDKKQKKLTYTNALLKIYDFPVFYLPKFFHPDPSVKRQSGFLQPKINKSNVLGSSINTPYFHVLSHDKDFTFNPTIFDSDVKLFQGEYRQKNESSSFIADFGLTTNFQSNYSKQKKNITHFFSKFDADLKFSDFNESDLEIYIERTNKDTFLKIFDDNLLSNNIRPKDYNILTSGLTLNLDHELYVLDTGFLAYENLDKSNSDRFQFVLPYYNFSSQIYSNDYGNIDFLSKGNNTLQNTNNLRTKIINDVNIFSDDYISTKFGLKNNLNLYLKNVNTMAKEDEIYKSSPQSELMNIIELNTSLPNVRKIKDKTEMLTPKLSFRVNPSDMKNHSDADRIINANNIFSIDRLGLEDSFESGKSLTVGIDYENKSSLNDDAYSVKLATVFRDADEETLPTKSTLNKKESHIFGSVNYKNSDFLNLTYDFTIDNNLKESKYHGLEFDLSVNNFVTTFNFIEEGDVIGSRHILENETTYQHNENNFLSFRTRRNKEINLTEYYDLIYEYKNDCLIAGIKFNKSYYEDRDLKPSENLMFSITLVPITNYEQEIDQNIFDQSFWK